MTVTIPFPDSWSHCISRGRFIGFTWRGGDGAIRWQVYIPVGSPGYADGAIVAGGTFGTIADTMVMAIDAIETAIAQNLATP